MKTFEFSIVASGLDPEAEDFADRFFVAGCDDATVSFQKGRIILDFARAAASLQSAIAGAVDDVAKAGAKVDRIEPDPLVSLIEIAARSAAFASASRSAPVRVRRDAARRRSKRARIGDSAARAARKACSSSSSESALHTATPRTLLPRASSRGEKTPIPNCPGSTASKPPAIPSVTYPAMRSRGRTGVEFSGLSSSTVSVTGGSGGAAIDS